jgi:hypothetical protein
MGGFGSGQRWNSKATTSNYGQLDVRDWQREGLLVVGRSFLYWPWDVEVIATMKRDEPNMVRLYHRDGSGQQREPYRVWIEWTPCNYGGRRAWFVCPRGCGHRVAILYYGDSPACRHCRQLAYESQQDSGWHRSLRQARTARMRLGGSVSLAEPLPGKPKGMHWRTYRRLYSQAAAHEQVCLGGAVTMMTSLERSISRLNGRG